MGQKIDTEMSSRALSLLINQLEREPVTSQRLDEVFEEAGISKHYLNEWRGFMRERGVLRMVRPEGHKGPAAWVLHPCVRARLELFGNGASERLPRTEPGAPEEGLLAGDPEESPLLEPPSEGRITHQGCGCPIGQACVGHQVEPRQGRNHLPKFGLGLAKKATGQLRERRVAVVPNQPSSLFRLDNTFYGKFDDVGLIGQFVEGPEQEWGQSLCFTKTAEIKAAIKRFSHYPLMGRFVMLDEFSFVFVVEQG